MDDQHNRAIDTLCGHRSISLEQLLELYLDFDCEEFKKYLVYVMLDDMETNKGKQLLKINQETYIKLIQRADKLGTKYDQEVEEFFILYLVSDEAVLNVIMDHRHHKSFISRIALIKDRKILLEMLLLTKDLNVVAGIKNHKRRVGRQWFYPGSLARVS